MQQGGSGPLPGLMLPQKGAQGREGIDADGDEPDAAFKPGVGLDGRERLIKGAWLLRLNGKCRETLLLLPLKFALALRLSGFRGCFFCGVQPPRPFDGPVLPARSRPVVLLLRRP